VSIPRGTTLAGRLASLGFADADRAESLITGELALDIKGQDSELVEALATAADPDAALAGLVRLAPGAELRAALWAEPVFRTRLTAVLGASAALTDHLARHPGDWQELSGPQAVSEPAAGELRARLLVSVGADPADPEPSSDPARLPGRDRTSQDTAGLAPATSLRVAYRRGLLRLAARDLAGLATLDQVAAELADLAAAALEAALAIARSQLPPGAAPCRLAVIAMGKCGGRELNYASDVDVIFVAEPGSQPAWTTPRPCARPACWRPA
jgi:glutamate-ammonia-ligase adenylyltransferase